MKQDVEINFCFKNGGKASITPETRRAFQVGKALKGELEKTCKIMNALEVKDSKSEVYLEQVERETDYYRCLTSAIKRYISDPENFGKCQECGKDIPLDRLKLVPVCKHCIDCKHS